MSPLVLCIVGIAAVLGLAAFRLPIALALAIVGVVGTGALKGWSTVVYVGGAAPFEALNNYALSVLPMFILMGSLAVRSGLSVGLINAANGFLGHRRGGLASAATVSCAGFGAISGSDIATLSAMTKIAGPEMLRVGYSPRLAAGALAAGGTLGILIPPSVPMIVFGYMTETSIGRLFSGGIVPGIILTLLYVGGIALWTRLVPGLAPTRARLPFADRLRLLTKVWGVLVVFVVMMGGIYFGIFSPTEGGAVGAAGVLITGLATRGLSLRDIVAAVRESVQLSAVIFFILIGIVLFHFFMDAIGLRRYAAGLAESSSLPPILVVSIILLILMILGCVMDSLAIMFITVPFLNPIITGLGYDPVWFGVVMVMVVSLGLITPPFGLNVFLISTMMREISVAEAFRGVLPFVVADVLLIAATVAFPGLVLWLPTLLFG